MEIKRTGLVGGEREQEKKRKKHEDEKELQTTALWKRGARGRNVGSGRSRWNDLDFD